MRVPFYILGGFVLFGALGWILMLVVAIVDPVKSTPAADKLAACLEREGFVETVAYKADVDSGSSDKVRSALERARGEVQYGDDHPLYGRDTDVNHPDGTVVIAANADDAETIAGKEGEVRGTLVLFRREGFGPPAEADSIEPCVPGAGSDE